jgi:hypothetical protein
MFVILAAMRAAAVVASPTVFVPFRISKLTLLGLVVGEGTTVGEVEGKGEKELA